MEDRNLQKEILDELRKLNRLTGLSITQNLAPGEKIITLAQAGLVPKEIAEILGITPNLVSVTLFKARQKEGKKRTSKGSTAKEMANV